MKANIIMIGPSINGLGGISRVVKTWYNNGFFQYYKIHYIESVSDYSVDKILFTIGAIIKFLLAVIKVKIVYVHTSSYNSFRRKAIFIFLGLVFKKKIILHIHPTHFINYLYNLNLLEKIVVLGLLKKVDDIIVLTTNMKNEIRTILPNKPTHILPNPVDMDLLSPGKIEERENSKFLFLGWFIREKGVYELVDAFTQLLAMKKDVCLEFFGTKQVEELKQYIKAKHISKGITVHGWVDDKQKVELLQKCTAMILPSYSEGIPNVILEAMATKTPIISTAVGGLKEILKNGINAIIINVGDVNDIVEKVMQCLENDKLRSIIVENAYNNVLSNYSVPVVRKAFKEIMEKILK